MYATFGRPHTLLFAWLMWATVVALAGGGRGRPPALDRGRRAARAVGLRASDGAAVRADGVRCRVALRTRAASGEGAKRLAGRGGAARHVRAVLRKTLHVLSDRYGVGGSGQYAGRTFSGRPVWEDALHFVAPGRHDVNYFTVLAAARCRCAARAPRSPAARSSVSSTVAAPVVFFSVVPTSGDSALFFDRYMIPVDARVPRPRLRRRSSQSHRGQVRCGCLSLSCSSRVSRRSRSDTTSPIAARRIGSASTPSSPRCSTSRRAPFSSARPARAVRTSRRSTTGTRRTFSTIWSRFGSVPRPRRRRGVRASRRSCTARSALRVVAFLRGVARRDRRRRRRARHGADRWGLLRRAFADAARSACARARGAATPPRVEASSSVQPPRRRAPARRSQCPCRNLCSVRRSRRSWDLTALAAREDNPSMTGIGSCHA